MTLTEELTAYDQYLNLNTGEVDNGVFISSREIKKKQEATIKQTEGYLKKKKKDSFSKFIGENLGSFYFNNYMKLLKKLNNDTALLFRFLYLCTYADFDGYLRYGKSKSNTNGKYMTEKDFEEVFNMSKSMTLKLKKELFDNKLIIKSNKDTRLSINDNYYTRGKLDTSNMLECSRVFDSGIKELYEQSKPREHKKLGVLIPLLPYLNKYHNILCKKPLEKEIEYIEPLNLREICKIVNYDIDNEDKLKKQLENITVRDLPLVASVSHSKCKFFIMNPTLFYKGNRIDDLIGVINLFKVTE